MRAILLTSMLMFSMVGAVSAEKPPPTEWEMFFGGDLWEKGNSVQQTSDGGFILLGETGSYGAGSSDIWLVKVGRLGRQGWSKTFGGSGRESGYSVQQTSDDGFIMLGYTDSYGAGGDDFWLIRADRNGNELWNKTFGGSGRDVGLTVQQTPDGGFIMLGYTDSYGAGGDDFWLIRADRNGNELWNKTFGGSDDDVGGPVQLTSDGGFILLGYTDSYGAREGDVALIRTDRDGNELWNKTFGGSGGEGGGSVQQTSDGGFILLGSTSSYGAGAYDSWLIRTDGNGNGLWSKTFGGPWDDHGASVQQASDGGFILLGTSDIWGDYSASIVLTRTDPDGNELWTKEFGGEDGDDGNSVQLTSDGGFILLGNADYGYGDQDMLLVRMTSEDLPCDLKVSLGNYPVSVGRGETHSFRADVTNNCDNPLTFDQAVMNIKGPARLENVLYDASPLTVRSSVGADVSLQIPPFAPWGTYTVEVTAYRDAEAIDAGSFKVNLTE